MALLVNEKQAAIQKIYRRYQKSGKKDKTKILDEITRITGHNRKYLLHLLTNWGKISTLSLGGKRITLKAAPPKSREKSVRVKSSTPQK